METITAKKIDMRFDECYLKDAEGNYKPYVCVACDAFLTFRSKTTIAVNKLCDCFDILAMKDWNGAEKSLRRQYIVNDLPDCIEPQEKNLLRKMILSPRASYITFEDNRKTDGYTICRQCKYHLCRVEIPTMACANNNMYGVPPKYLKDLTHVEAAFISPVRSYGYVFTYTGGKQRQLKGVLSYYKVEMESIARSALHFEIVGMEKHIVTLLYGPMTAEQKSTVKQKSTIRPNHVLKALKWLVKYNSEWKERNINLSKIRDSLQQPVVIDSSYAVHSEDSNVETTESFEVFSPMVP